MRKSLFCQLFWSALACDGSKLKDLDFDFMGFLNARTHKRA